MRGASSGRAARSVAFTRRSVCRTNGVAPTSSPLDSRVPGGWGVSRVRIRPLVSPWRIGLCGGPAGMIPMVPDDEFAADRARRVATVAFDLDGTLVDTMG